MIVRKGLVLDANILLRAVFGEKVRQILGEFEEHANFYSPEVCFQVARRYIPDVASRKNLDADLTLSVLDLPIWTENQEFFGTGISTWTTDRVEVFLRKSD